VKDTEIIVIQNSSEKQQIHSISCIKEYFIHIFHLCSIKQKHKTVLNAINVNNSKVPVFTLDFDLISSHIDYSYKLGENAVLSWNEKYLKKLL